MDAGCNHARLATVEQLNCFTTSFSEQLLWQLRRHPCQGAHPVAHLGTKSRVSAWLLVNDGVPVTFRQRAPVQRQQQRELTEADRLS